MKLLTISQGLSPSADVNRCSASSPSHVQPAGTGNGVFHALYISYGPFGTNGGHISTTDFNLTSFRQPGYSILSICVSSIICVTRKGEREGRQTEETAYYISSREGEAEEVAKCIQGHWSIENNLHWSLDTAFNEDESQIYRGHAQENLSVVRKIAQGLLKSETTFKGGSIRRKSNRAAMSDEYAELVLKLGVNQ